MRFCSRGGILEAQTIRAATYIQQPLQTSGSIAFPGIIEHDTPNDLYVLRYFTSFEIPSAEVVLYVKRADLSAAFTR
jgi:hypothetical protein